MTHRLIPALIRSNYSTSTSARYLLTPSISYPYLLIYQLSKQFYQLSISPHCMDFFQALSNLDPSKASGIDSINPALLKCCAESLTIPIQYLFTFSLRTQSLQQEWCTHCIVPVFKSGDKSLVNNYRPISLLCIVSKVLNWESYFIIN